MEETLILIDNFNKEKKSFIKKYRDDNGIRCSNCKSVIRSIKNDFKLKSKCTTCWMSGEYDLSLRKDMFILTDGKWEKKKSQ